MARHATTRRVAKSLPLPGSLRSFKASDAERRRVTPSARVVSSVCGLAALTLAGALGYIWIEGFSWIDALYMSIITISTVGYGEVRPLTPLGRLYTSGLIVVGVGVALFLLTRLAEAVFAGSLRDLIHRRSMQRSIDQLSDHIIVCGFGRFGQVVVDEIDPEARPVVVIESDLNREPALRRAGCPYILGSALDDHVLKEAGIERAAELVACTGSDADTLFITLSAREHHPEIRVHARAESETAIRRLRTAGAHQVISSYQMGAQRIAASILRPAVVDFLEIAKPRGGGEVDLEEVRVSAHSALAGRAIGQVEGREQLIRIVALKRGRERIELVPSADTSIRGGDHLVVIGERGALAELSELATADDR